MVECFPGKCPEFKPKYIQRKPKRTKVVILISDKADYKTKKWYQG
jgi:hypothetical protein